MARFHPPECSSTQRAFFNTFRALKKQLDDRYEIWQRLPHQGPCIPCFTVRDARGCMCFIRVATLKANDPNNSLQTTMASFDESDKNLFDEVLSGIDRTLLIRIPVLWLFPNVRDDSLWLPKWVRKHSLSKEELKQKLGPWLEQNMRRPGLDDAALDQMMTRLQTETGPVPAPLKPPPKEVHFNLEVNLDYDQRKAAKLEMFIPNKEKTLANNFGVRLITGVAGSGKSLVLLHRLDQIRKNWPNHKVLVLIHNRPILRVMERRYQELSHGDYKVDWRTFMGWCRHIYGNFSLIPESERMQIIENLCKKAFPRDELSKKMLSDEFGFIKDRLIFNRQTYLDADRSGRGFRLPYDMRIRVHEAFKSYQQALQSRSRIDWWDPPRLLWQRFSRGTIPKYDFILIDEAQFFAPIWFELVKRALPEGGSLFLTADPAQGFLKRRQTWISAGLAVKGRSKHLSRSYRTTRTILAAALKFVDLRLGNETPQKTRLEDMEPGEAPLLCSHKDDFEESRWLMDRLDEFAERHEGRDILILVPTARRKDMILEKFAKSYGRAHIWDCSNTTGWPDRNAFRMCTLKAATGLEAAVVFVLGLHEFFAAEENPMLSEEERGELIEQHTRLVYMAMTRASQKLLLSCVGSMPETLKQALAPDDLQEPDEPRSQLPLF